MPKCPKCGGPAIRNGYKYNKQDIKCKVCSTRSLVGHGNVLVIGDTHIPFEHKDYLGFVLAQRDRYGCETVVHIGDLVDNHAISYHEHDPDGKSPGAEFEEAARRLEVWAGRIGAMHICSGNHDMLPMRQAKSHGLPRVLLRNFNEIWNLPKSWEWSLETVIDDVRYMHGSGKAGKYMHINWAVENMMSTVSGHGHSNAGVGFQTSRNRTIFGMGVGCGLDATTYAMQYGESFARRPVLGCGVVLDDGRLPIFIPME